MMVSVCRDSQRQGKKQGWPGHQSNDVQVMKKEEINSRAMVEIRWRGL